MAALALLGKEKQGLEPKPGAPKLSLMNNPPRPRVRMCALGRRLPGGGGFALESR